MLREQKHGPQGIKVPTLGKARDGREKLRREPTREKGAPPEKGPRLPRTWPRQASQPRREVGTRGPPGSRNQNLSKSKSGGSVC